MNWKKHEFSRAIIPVFFLLISTARGWGQVELKYGQNETAMNSGMILFLA